MSDATLNRISPARMVEYLKETGYRASLVERGQLTQIQSAVQGLTFTVGFGNAHPEHPDEYVDFGFHCPLSVQGELPDEVIAGWNRQKRFARLYRQGTMLVMTLDVMLAGGVNDPWLRGQCELWDHLVSELVLYLRQRLARDPAPQAEQAPRPEQASPESG